MTPKIRNHYTSLCLLYMKYNHPEDAKLLQSLAEANYPNGYRQMTLLSVWNQFKAKKAQQAQLENI